MRLFKYKAPNRYEAIDLDAVSQVSRINGQLVARIAGVYEIIDLPSQKQIEFITLWEGLKYRDSEQSTSSGSD